MIDLHIHTKHSDGDSSVSEVLKVCENEKLTAMSIADHDTVAAYAELGNPQIRKLFGGTIIPAVEISAECNGMPIEILGYGINPQQITKTLRTISEDDRRAFFADKLLEKARELGLEFDLTENERQSMRIAYKKFMEQNREYLANLNKDFIADDIVKAYTSFYRHAMNNRHSVFCITYDGLLQSAKAAVTTIHASGGTAYLAHPAEYGEFANEILDEIKNVVDGVECFHPSANPKFRKYLLDFCKKHNLRISGGSDFHGYKNKINCERVPDWVLGQLLD